MTRLGDLWERYRSQLVASFNKQDEFTTRKIEARAKRVLPRGKAYRKLIMLEVNKHQ